MTTHAENVAPALPASTVAREAADGVPEAIMRAGRVRGYLMAEAMVSAVSDLIALVGRQFRGGQAKMAEDATGPRL